MFPRRCIYCFLDLRKTSDTVDYSILISKLYKLGIRGPILKWLKSYLSNRQQLVQIHKTKSDSNLLSVAYQKEVS